MEDVTLILTLRTPAAKKATTSVTYVNPDVSNAKLRELAAALVGFTNNTLQSIKKEVQETI